MEIEKAFSGVFPRNQENPFAHSCSFTLQISYKNDMLGPGRGGGGGGGAGCQDAL